MKLHAYQEAGIDFVEQQRRGIVILGVGKGKTEIAKTPLYVNLRPRTALIGR